MKLTFESNRQCTTVTHIAKPLNPTLKPELGKECVCRNDRQTNARKITPKR